MMSQFSYMLIMNLVTSQINYYATDLLYIPVAMVGTITITGKLMEVLTAPFTGLMIERIRMPWGKYRSWLMVACVPFVIFHCLIFSVAKLNLGPMGSAVVFAVFLYIASLAGNITQSVHSSLVQGITYRDSDRKKLVKMNSAGNYLAKAATGFMTLPLIAFFAARAGSEADGFSIVLLIIAALAIGVYFFLSMVVKKFKVDEEDEDKEFTVKETLKLTFSNKYLLYAFGTLFMKSGAYFVVIGSTSYYFKWVVQDMSKQSLFMTTINFVALGAVLLSQFFFKYLSNKKGYRYALLLMMGGALVARFAGANYMLFIVAMCFFAFGDSVVGMYSHILFAEAVDYCEYKNGASFRGLAMSLHTLALDGSRIIQQIVIAIGLSAIGYSAAIGVTPDKFSALLNMICLVPVGLLAIAVFLLSRYRLDAATMKQCRAELARRRAVAAEAKEA